MCAPRRQRCSAGWPKPGAIWERWIPPRLHSRPPEYREGSYEERQSKEMDDVDELVAALLTAIPAGGLKRGKLADFIREKEVPDGSESRRLPKGMDAKDFRDHLIHQGIFQPEAGGKLTCPIPSLRSWLIDRAAPEPDQAKLEKAPETAALRAFGSAAEQAEPERERPGGRNQDRGEGR